ncbi:MAG: FMN-binding protein [Ruminococcus sp.]|jgi:electron transport complex protein RnfG|nr:FMN-binding protein [Ruminococcus sp.]
MQKIKPSLVLIIVCVIFTALLIFVHDLTETADSGGITDDVKVSLTEIYGNADFEVLETGLELSDSIDMIMKNSSGEIAVKVTADGYNKDGITLIIGFGTDNAVRGISIMSMTETPGLGTKTDSTDFLGQFTGFTPADIPAAETPDNTKYTVRFGSQAEIDALKAENAPETAGFTLDAITGATLSSNGVYSAVQAAAEAVKELS